MSRLYGIIDKIIDRSKGETITPTVTRISGGTVSDVTAQKIGPLVLLQFRVTNTSSVEAGGDIFVGELSSYRPPGTIYAPAYYARYPIITGMASNGRITMRNTAGTAVTISAGIGVTFIYAIIE